MHDNEAAPRLCQPDIAWMSYGKIKCKYRAINSYFIEKDWLKVTKAIPIVFCTRTLQHYVVSTKSNNSVKENIAQRIFLIDERQFEWHNLCQVYNPAIFRSWFHHSQLHVQCWTETQYFFFDIQNKIQLSPTKVQGCLHWSTSILQVVNRNTASVYTVCPRSPSNPSKLFNGWNNFQFWLFLKVVAMSVLWWRWAVWFAD